METPIPNYKKYLFEQLKLNITCVNDLYIYTKNFEPIGSYLLYKTLL